MLTINTHQVVNNYNLKIANRFIDDDVATVAYEVNPNDDVFELKITNPNN